jgi:hypothetical protein
MVTNRFMLLVNAVGKSLAPVEQSQFRPIVPQWEKPGDRDAIVTG